LYESPAKLRNSRERILNMVAGCCCASHAHGAACRVSSERHTRQRRRHGGQQQQQQHTSGLGLRVTGSHFAEGGFVLELSQKRGSRRTMMSSVVWCCCPPADGSLVLPCSAANQAACRYFIVYRFGEDAREVRVQAGVSWREVEALGRDGLGRGEVRCLVRRCADQGKRCY
jgi:hypothetical protein